MSSDIIKLLSELGHESGGIWQIQEDSELILWRLHYR